VRAARLSCIPLPRFTDESPPQIAAAGHDRCIIPIKPENLDAWISPGADLKALHAILDDRARPCYERIAIAIS